LQELEIGVSQTQNKDIVATYNYLKMASENHLRAFVRRLKMQGINYEPAISISLVTLQFVFILLLLLGTPLNNIPALAFTFIILSILLVLWAVLAMQKSKLRILPEPSLHATLITNGPYRLIRHPMYTAILLAGIGLLILQFTWIRLAITIALAIVLLFKLFWEERLLSRKFEAYEQYTKNTYRLIPFIF
jgi:protein-S-isoprenylcysteine O-methyltransferase Ste14